MIDDLYSVYSSAPPLKQSKYPSTDKVSARYLMRLRLLKLGYEPIPICGKAPHIGGWQKGEITPERIFDWCADVSLLRPGNDHANTGLRTGRLVGIDIDLHDPAHVASVREMVDVVLGPTPFQRRGSKGMMLSYRQIEEPMATIVLAQPKPKGSDEKAKTLVEFLMCGRQYVAYGRHPETLKPYEWLVPGQEPLLTAFNDLPPVTN